MFDEKRETPSSANQEKINDIESDQKSDTKILDNEYLDNNQETKSISSSDSTQSNKSNISSNNLHKTSD